MSGSRAAAEAVAAAVEALRHGQPIGLITSGTGLRAVAVPASAATAAWARDAQRASGAPARAVVSAASGNRWALGHAHPSAGADRQVTATISVDLADRPGDRSADALARVLRALADPATTAAMLARPGQLFPSAVPAAGVLATPVAEAAALDLAAAAGVPDVLAFCELPERGRGVDAPAQRRLAARVRAWVEVAAVLQWRLSGTTVSGDSGWTRLPTPHGLLQVRAYRSENLAGERLLLAATDRDACEAAAAGTIAVHDECLLAAAGHTGCDCDLLLATDLRRLAAGDGRAVVYRMRAAGLLGHAAPDPAGHARECGVLGALLGLPAQKPSPTAEPPATDRFAAPSADPTERHPVDATV